MFCTQCGKDNGEGNKFCIECGALLTNPNAVETPAPEPEAVQEAAPAPEAEFVPTAEAAPVSSPEETLDVFAGQQNNAQQGASDGSTTILGNNIKLLLESKDDDFEIISLPAIVGKGSKADIIIPGDESISRQHFCIHEYGDNGFVIEDLGATNKTYLNGNVLAKEELVVLNDNDKIKAGQTELTVHVIN